MHIPPYYKKRTWQSFFLGVLAGVIIGYLFFLFVYGKHTERWIEENMEIRTELKQVKQENDLLKQDKENLNEKHEEKLTIQSFEINLSNAKDLELDRFTEYELIEKIEDELNPVIGRNIASVSEQRDLLIRTIENQTYHVRDINYSVKISHLTVAPILVVTVEVTVETGGATL
uniref:sporulation membrane protein YtrI n=1 Tax=uncultured Allobacillus sp. TaxID=1638025 RepID=UPI002594FFC1|nr:sporulation membrane protein YtrI [uncultured Allobacillus sp.]